MKIIYMNETLMLMQNTGMKPDDFKALVSKGTVVQLEKTAYLLIANNT